MQGLSALPAWDGKILLNGATWPLEATEYTALANHLPSSYDTWQVGADMRPKSELFGAVAQGVNQTRASLGLGDLTVLCPRFSEIGDWAETHVGIGSHVVLTRAYDEHLTYQDSDADY